METAINIFDATFTNDITLTLNVGFGSINGRPMKPQDGENGGLGAPNAAVFVTYSQLRDRLMASGQPGFFNAANLPAGDSINGMSNFWVSSSQAKALGLPLQNPGLVDGFIGFAVGAFGVGAGRIAEILHEIGHAMGRYSLNVDSLDRTLPLQPDANPPRSPTPHICLRAGPGALHQPVQPPVRRQCKGPDAGIFFGRRWRKESGALGRW